MTIQVCLTHRTEYHYDRPVMLSPQVVRLRPAPHARGVLSYAMDISPKGHFVNWQQDPQGNWLARLVFPEPATEFVVTVDLVADLTVINPFDFFLEPSAETFPFAYDEALAHELAPFRLCETAGPLLSAFLATIDRNPLRTVDFLMALNQRLQGDVRYTIRMEPGVQSCEETLTKLSGSCRDSAWLMVQVLRHLGFAARFVSGYLIQLVPDVKPLDGPAGPSADFTDLHAWTEVYLPGGGWIGLDPTSGLLAGEGHIPLACSPDPSSAAPITGRVGACEVTFAHHMEVRRIHETPRVTKPYAEAQWQAIDALGDAIDAKLIAGDVRLTMGGEPTFVSAEDMEGEEWNTAAVGPTKRALAHDLILRLRERFAPGGLLTFGQGKWYPGESLPRWAFSLYWRGDGLPLWHDARLVAHEKAGHAPTVTDAEAFGKALCQRLEVDADCLMAGYEDPWHYLHEEGKLPPNVDPLDSKLANPEDRDRLRRVFERGLDSPIGFALPLQRWNAKAGPHWVTSKWPLRNNRMVVLPGDSPLGLRLPLESLPWQPADQRTAIIPQDPFDHRPAFAAPRRQAFRSGQRPAAANAPGTAPQSLDSSGEAPHDGTIIRTVLTIEPREGKLCLFLPPVERTEDYLDLVAAIEDTATALAMPVHVEGYEPPSDHRLNLIKVTPDPGVIEVNIHPAASWRQLVETTTVIYDEAHQCRLGTEKFMVDGRHVGTGGGNHVVVGGATPADSPFLRRPDLLGSLIRYWQNHPSLSYLFSGLFIGPTSQAPRVDEGRDDALYELGIALSQLPPAPQFGMGTEAPPWLVDRILRNLLVDLTGNTHRTEICIDKLYSPDGPTGRLGLVEFRAFEMPPHPHMSLAQQLLLRGLIARFWDTPYTAPLVRWGHALRDRFMLPHFLCADFHEIIDDMRAAGFAFEHAWYAPHMEFRFPHIGTIQRAGLNLELRQALEPWHVMGEEAGGGGTVRFVDSSVERLQVKVTNFTANRHWVACNGRRVPLTPTGTPGEFVAGVRYRAWQPASCLHPNIKVHSPLTFDVVDGWNERSMGGCTYHVAHPGGRNYDTFPVNSYEAAARRRGRFLDHGHTAGPMAEACERPNQDFPLTLDLRMNSLA